MKQETKDTTMAEYLRMFNAQTDYHATMVRVYGGNPSTWPDGPFKRGTVHQRKWEALQKATADYQAALESLMLTLKVIEKARTER